MSWLSKTFPILLLPASAKIRLLRRRKRVRRQAFRPQNQADSRLCCWIEGGISFVDTGSHRLLRVRTRQVLTPSIQRKAWTATNIHAGAKSRSGKIQKSLGRYKIRGSDQLLPEESRTLAQGTVSRPLSDPRQMCDVPPLHSIKKFNRFSTPESGPTSFRLERDRFFLGIMPSMRSPNQERN